MIAILGLLLSLIRAQHFCNDLTSALCDHEFLCYWDGTLCVPDTLAQHFPDTTTASYDLAHKVCPSPVADPSLLGCYIEEYEYAADETILLVYSTPQGADYCSVDYDIMGDDVPDATRCPATSCELYAGGCYDYCTLHSDDPSCVVTCPDLYATGCACANDPWTTGCYPNTTNAGICEGRNTYACSAIPFCHWNSSKCQPDWKCYYSFINGIAPNNVNNNRVCNSTSVDAGGSACKNETIDTILYCTSDLITTTDETCLKASADQATCEAAGCEWIPPGTGNRPYNGWCVEIGSGASIARLSSIGLIVLLSIMLTFL